MMKRVLLVLGLIAFVYGDDPSVGVAAQAHPFNIANPGITLDYSHRLGLRTDVGLSAALTEAPERALQAGLYLRPLWSVSLSSQWYPQVSVIWASDVQQWEPWLGIGLQQRILPEAALLAEAHWLSRSNQLYVRLGVRFWLDRFGHLDARVRDAQPLGATLKPGESVAALPNVVWVHEQPPVTSVSAVETASTVVKPNETDAVRHLSVVTPPVPPEATDANAMLPNPLVETSGEHFLHLGLFVQVESARSIMELPQLAPWPLGLWYDPTRRAYRLLIGPLNHAQIELAREQLRIENIAAFDYQKPTELTAYESLR